jgi:myo-inositol-1-phosphate synthase
MTLEGSEIMNSTSAFERALDTNTEEISPAMLYAYAAICERVPYGNFTPSVAADVPALVKLAENEKVPIAGKDGKTGQTFIKSVLAPALKSRSLKVDGWYSTNILGNRDGLALSNEDSLASKVKTKSSVLEDILGYEVEDHIVDIRYYRPRGDNKEAWDNIDISGFLGQPMQIKVNFLCKDSILAAPLAIEIARCLELAQRRGEHGVQEQLSVFFKLPMTKSGRPEQAFHKQEQMLSNWLSS